MPAFGQTYRALRGDGAYRDDRRIRVSDVDRLDEAHALLFQPVLVRAGRAPGRLSCDLADRTQRQRGFGDFYGFVLVAQGSGELMVEQGVHVWDVAAIKPLVEEAGGRFSDWDGNPTIHRTGRHRQQRPAARPGLAYLATARSWTAPQQAPRTIAWVGDVDGFVRLIDQTLLPTQLAYRDCRTVEEIWEAIRTLRVAGPRPSAWRPPWAWSLACSSAATAAGGLRAPTAEVTDYLRTSRPTAVNLFWALDRMERRVHGQTEQVPAGTADRAGCWTRPWPSRRKTAACAGPSAAPARP